MGELVTIDLRKYPDAPLRRSTGRLLGTDEHGTWIGLAVGDAVDKADGTGQPRQTPVVYLVPPAGTWWKARHFTDGGWKVDIATPPVWDGDIVTLADLDLDVRRQHGRLWIEDEDEFAERRALGIYPDDVVRAALAATAKVEAALRADVEPFASIGTAWLASMASPGR